MVGIISYGAYVPKYRIKVEEIAKVHGGDAEFIKTNLLIEEKSVPGIDEDSLTMSVESSINALKKIDIIKQRIGAVYSGSESPVYAVKPNASIVGEILDIGDDYTSADVQFACKAGTAALQMALGLLKSGFIKYGLAIGTDTSQASPGDILEFTASAGAAAFIVGNKKDEMIAELEEMCSVSSDTPDFWRRSMQKYPMHTERFTGAPAYLKHVTTSTRILMKRANITIGEIDHVAFHTPNGKFPLNAGELLGFPKQKLLSNLIVSKIGNTYSAASLLVLSHILDKAKPGERILVTSYGGGAGSDSFLFRVTNKINRLKKKIRDTQGYMEEKEYVSYAKYCKCIGVV